MRFSGSIDTAEICTVLRQIAVRLSEPEQRRQGCAVIVPSTRGTRQRPKILVQLPCPDVRNLAVERIRV